MYYITRDEWNKIPKDYKGVSIYDKNIKTCFECFMPNAPKGSGATLIFEHQHFEIIENKKEA